MVQKTVVTRRSASVRSPEPTGWAGADGAAGGLGHATPDPRRRDDHVVIEDHLRRRRRGGERVDLVIGVERDALEQHVGVGAEVEALERLLVDVVLAPAVEVVAQPAAARRAGLVFADQRVVLPERQLAVGLADRVGLRADLQAEPAIRRERRLAGRR